MVVLLKQNAEQQQICALISRLEGMGVSVQRISGQSDMLVLVGDTTCLDADCIQSMAAVERVVRVNEPYKLASRAVHKQNTVVNAGGVLFGGGNFQIIAGPCTVESPEQITLLAQQVRAAGATMLRGGAFKPRTSPYAFQGLGADGIKMLVCAGRAAGLPVVSEIMDLRHLDLFEGVDVIQVGARNMQNYELLKQLGRCGKPILLKRGPSSTLQELLMSAEYIMAGGNGSIILCERGVQSRETYTRNTFDVSAIPLLHQKTHLPVIADPSHAGGISYLVQPIALSAAAAGADGLIIEVHSHPEQALCDGAQSVTPAEFANIVRRVKAVRAAIEQ